MKFNIQSACIAFATLCASSCYAADRFTITGYIPEVTDSLMITLKNAERDGTRLARVYTTDGYFTLSDTVKMPSMCNLVIARRGGKFNYFSTLASPRIMVENADIKVTFAAGPDSLASAYVPETLMHAEGSKSHDEFVTYLHECLAAERRAGEAESIETKKYFSTEGNADTVAHYEKMSQLAEADLRAARRRFISSHPGFHISAYLVLKELNEPFTCTGEDMARLVEMAKNCPDTARVRLIDRRYERAKRYCLCQKYADFNIEDANSITKPFSDYITPGKYTFIDFWASWCGPCRAAIPHVRKLHERYADRMDVYSISLDENRDAWRKAMAAEKMEWTQLHATKEQMKDVTTAYMIKAIPRLVLIDDRGRIVCSTSSPNVIDAYLQG